MQAGAPQHRGEVSCLPGAMTCWLLESQNVLREIVEQAVGLAFGVQAAALRAPTRSRAPIALARQVAMYLAHVTCGLSMTDAGALFGRDRTTVAYACNLVEDRRDDPRFDALVDSLESAVTVLMETFRSQSRAVPHG